MPGEESAAPQAYLDFELEIGPGQGRDYPLAARSPAGEARAVMHFPFDDLLLENRLLNLQVTLLRSGVRQRQVLSPEEDAAQQFGRELFAALLPGEVLALYRSSVTQAAHCRGLRLKLHIQTPELAALPWEFLYDPRTAEYVCLSAQTPLVRYIDAPQPVRPLEVAPPLRILGVIADPSDLPRLDVSSEKQRLERALADAQRRGLLHLEWLENPSARQLQRKLGNGEYHIFHFIGHGGFDEHSDEGMLALVGEGGQRELLHASRLALLLADHRPLRLAVLNACKGAQGSSHDLFSSTAAILVRRGLPAVLAMQYEINDRAAIRLSQAFYEGLADGLPVDAAVAEARKAIRLAAASSLEWGVPVLFMRTRDGVLFRLESSGKEPPRPETPWLSAAWTALRRRAPWALGSLLVGVFLVLSTILGRRTLISGQQTATAVVEKTTAALMARVESATPSLTAQPTRTPFPTPLPSPTFTLHPSKTPTLALSPTPTPLPARITDTHGVQMALIPAGEFWMGSENGNSDEQPVHKVYLNAFYMDIYETTNALYEKCVQAKVCKPLVSSGQADHPVINVTWDQARTFCEWRNARLPTEAEWEKAARGGLEGKLYPWGGESPDCQRANFRGCVGDTSQAGSYPANGYGLFDMAGNVWEWVADWYGANYYASSPSEKPAGPDSGDSRVVRGGSWYVSANVVRSAVRYAYAPADRSSNLGFRCSRSP